MDEPLFRMVCGPAALQGAPDGWAAELLRDGHVALLPDDGALDGVNAVAHDLDAATVAVVRNEETPEAQTETVVAHAGSLPLVWLAAGFTDRARSWARERGPMTLLVEVDGALPEDERRRVDRFVALLGRQAE
jgi:hypothetical protein